MEPDYFIGFDFFLLCKGRIDFRGVIVGALSRPFFCIYLKEISILGLYQAFQGFPLNKREKRHT